MTDSPASPVRLRPEIEDLPAYRQGKQSAGSAHKLSSNENPFPPLPAVLAAIAESSEINRYPDATAARLRGVLAARIGVGVDQVHAAAGSVSILAQLISAAAGPGDEVVYPWRSFEAYPQLVTVSGATGVRVPLTAEGRHDLPAMAAAVTDRTRCVIVCTPNNPTGPALRRDEFAAFLDTLPRDLMVLLDEAYAEFVTDPDAVDGLGPHGYLDRPQVVVLRTFSKAYGLAGLRVGYAVGDPNVLSAARSTAIPLSVTAHAEVAALASLEADAESVLRTRVAALVERRERLAQGLRDAGWSVPVPQGNFVWLATGAETLDVAAAFESAGLIIRPFAGDGVRITVGEDQAVQNVLRVASSVVHNLPQGHPARTLA